MDPTRRWFLRASGPCLGMAALAGCSGILGGSGSTTPERDGGARTATDARGGSAAIPSDTANGRPGRETVSIETAGAEIGGTLYGRGDCGVVLVPQANLDRGSWEPQAEAIAGMGQVALAVDENPGAPTGSVLDAVRYLREAVGVDRVALVGAGTGGEAVLTANARAPTGTIEGTMTLSAAGGADHAGVLQGRLVFVVSEGDESRFVETANALADDAPVPAELVTYAGSARGQDLFDSRHAKDLRGRLTEFVSAVCESS